MEVTGAATTAFSKKKKILRLLSDDTYLTSHRQDAARMKNIQSKFRTAPICVKMFHSQCYLAATAIHTQSLHSQLFCVCIYTHVHNVETLVEEKK